MNTYKVTEIITYYVEGENSDNAWDNFMSDEFDKTDITNINRIIEEVKL